MAERWGVGALDALGRWGAELLQGARRAAGSWCRSPAICTEPAAAAAQTAMAG